MKFGIIIALLASSSGASWWFGRSQPTEEISEIGDINGREMSQLFEPEPKTEGNEVTSQQKTASSFWWFGGASTAASVSGATENDKDKTETHDALVTETSDKLRPELTAGDSHASNVAASSSWWPWTGRSTTAIIKQEDPPKDNLVTEPKTENNETFDVSALEMSALFDAEPQPQIADTAEQTQSYWSLWRLFSFSKPAESQLAVDDFHLIGRKAETIIENIVTNSETLKEGPSAVEISEIVEDSKDIKSIVSTGAINQVSEETIEGSQAETDTPSQSRARRVRRPGVKHVTLAKTASLQDICHFFDDLCADTGYARYYFSRLTPQHKKRLHALIKLYGFHIISETSRTITVKRGKINVRPDYSEVEKIIKMDNLERDANFSARIYSRASQPINADCGLIDNETKPWNIKGQSPKKVQAKPSKGWRLRQRQNNRKIKEKAISPWSKDVEALVVAESSNHDNELSSFNPGEFFGTGEILDTFHFGLGDEDEGRRPDDSKSSTSSDVNPWKTKYVLSFF